jgi:putative transposase
VVAVGVTSEGERQVLGIDVGPSEDRAFWTTFLRSLVMRGLRGVRLITSDAHEGLKQAIATALSGATWQRCRVHFMRNLLATVPKGAREAIAAVVRTILRAAGSRDGHDPTAQSRRRAPWPVCPSRLLIAPGD